MQFYHNSLSLSPWFYSPLDLDRFFTFLILYTVGRTLWTGDELVARPLPTHRTTQTQNNSIQTSMTRVGFEPMIPVFERAKTVHASDCAAIVIGFYHNSAANVSPTHSYLIRRGRDGADTCSCVNRFRKRKFIFPKS
jgi:hypothetical protein